MGRLGWALLLALALHILLLLASVPDHGRRLPGVKSPGRIIVSIDRPGPEPSAVSKGTMEAAAAVGAAADRWKKKRTAAVRPSEEVLPPQIRPQQTKKVIRAAMADDRGAAPEAVGKSAEVRSRFRSLPSRDTQAEGSGPAAGEAVRLAAPVPVEKRPPDYPELARRRNWEGTVLLAVRVGMDGRVEQVEVRTGSSYRLLDEAARNAVREWRFQPGTRNGRPEAMEVLVPVHFVLREAERR